MTYPKNMYAPDGACVLCKQSVHEGDLRRAGYTDEPPVEAPKAPDAPPQMAPEEAALPPVEAPATPVEAPKKRGPRKKKE